MIGRGITNSRSNYDVACQVAMGEALINTRFSLMRGELKGAGLADADLDRGCGRSSGSFRAEQYRSQLRVLTRELDRFAGRMLIGGVQLRAAVGRITSRMAGEIPELYAEGTRRKSDFFRDLAGSRYMQLAEDRGAGHGLGYDQVVGLFDKSILDVENSAEAAGRFEDHMRRGRGRDGRDRRRARARGVAPHRARTGADRHRSAPATAGSGCRFPKGRSSRRSSVTASARTRCSPGRGRCSTSAARTPRPSRWTRRASSRRSR